MKFFVEIEGKLAPVQVARPPKSLDSLVDFKRSNGSTYIGTPNLFAGLKLGGKAGIYTAVSVKAAIVSEPLPEHILVEHIESVVMIPVHVEEAIEEEEEEEEEEVEEREEEEEEEEYEEEMVRSEPCCSPRDDINHNEFNFIFDHNRVKPGSHNAAWVIYQNEKRLWIRRYGSEHLQLAFEMGCKCDAKYILERWVREFGPFAIHEEYAHSEIDTPEISTLRFLKQNAFIESQRVVLRLFNSRLVLGWPYEDEAKVPGTEMLIIQGFLGMCDLVCPLAEYIYYVEERSNQRV